MTDRIELRTERLLLRPYSLEDVDDVLAYCSDKELTQYVPGLPQPYTQSNAERYVARKLLKSWDSNPSFAIVLDSTVIGGINLLIDRKKETGELGYGIARTHWSKGLTTEGAGAVVDMAFDKLGLA